MATKVKLGTDAQWGVKENGLLGFNDENGVFKAIELASSRSSSATYVAESGLIADAEVGVPRIDWTNGVGELLLEPLSTNQFLYSEDFSQANWGKTRSSILTNQVISPDGTQNADKFLDTTDNNNHQTSQLTNSTGASDTVCASVFLKKAELRYVVLRITDNPANISGTGNAYDVYFDFDTATIVATGSNFGTPLNTFEGVVDYGNGWYRVYVGLDKQGGATRTDLNLFSYNDSAYNPNPTYTGTGTDGFYLWGAMIESKGYPTSYIPTEGSTVTRIADAVTGNSSLGQVINSSEGVLYFEGSALADDLTNRFISLSDGSATNAIHIYFSTSSNQIVSFVSLGGASQAVMIYNASDITTDFKIALKYKENDFAVWFNGTEVLTDVVGSTFSANVLDTLSFDNGNGANDFYGRIKELKVYDTALTDAELTTLTTL